jgi:hypothetical protein
VFHGFGQAEFPNGGLILSLSQFLILPQACFKGGQNGLENIISLPQSKATKLTLSLSLRLKSKTKIQKPTQPFAKVAKTNLK